MTTHSYMTSSALGMSRALRARRGVALLLVLISLGAAGALASFYLISQENSVEIGDNAGTASASEWAARTGAELGLAVLQTDQDWRTAASVDGRILKDVALGDAIVTVRVTALDGEPPRDDDTDLVITSVADIDGMTSTRQLVVELNPDASVEESIDEELGEFGVYALEGITLDADGLITVWSRNPRERVNTPANVGAGFALTSDLSIDLTSEIQRSTLFVTNSATSGLQELTQDVRFQGGGVIPMDRLPAAPALIPPTLRDLPVVWDEDTRMNLGIGIVMIGGAWRNVTVENGTEAVMTDQLFGQYRVESLTLSEESQLTIDGDVELLVMGDLVVEDDSAVHLADESSSLTLYLMGNMQVADGGVGVDPAIAAMDDLSVHALDSYTDPRRVRILSVSSVSGGLAEPSLVVDDNAIMLASIHAPTARMEVSEDAVFIGRATTRCLSVNNGGAFYCDPAIGVETGFTNLEGPLYANGALLEELADAMATWDDAMGVEALKAHLMSYYTEPTPEGAGVSAGPGAPTPRASARAEAREWPMRAFAMESDNRPSEAPDGDEPDPGCNDDGSFFAFADTEESDLEE